MQKTCKKHFGVNFAAQSSQAKNNLIKNNIKKYGVKHTSQLESAKQKVKLTKKEKYGNENYNNSKKRKQTCLKKYGVSNYMKTSKAREYFSKNKGFCHFCRYKYDNVNFDSSWELALYIYAKDHNEEIEREPYYIEYEFDGKIHRYFPDFKYKGELIEIKGNYLYEKMLIENTLDNAKLNLIKNLNIKVWNLDDLKFAIDYVKSKYGKDFKRRFKFERKN